MAGLAPRVLNAKTSPAAITSLILTLAATIYGSGTQEWSTTAANDFAQRANDIVGAPTADYPLRQQRDGGGIVRGRGNNNNSGHRPVIPKDTTLPKGHKRFVGNLKRINDTLFTEIRTHEARLEQETRLRTNTPSYSDLSKDSLEKP